jgi:hypothetical protein
MAAIANANNKFFFISLAKFVELGPADYYGWMFVSGGTWQGVTVGTHVILAPLGPGFVDLSPIPYMTEKDRGSRFDIAMDKNAKGVTVYPLIVTRWRLMDGKVIAPAQTMRIQFDQRRWRFKWPMTGELPPHGVPAI